MLLIKQVCLCLQPQLQFQVLGLNLISDDLFCFELHLIDLRNFLLLLSLQILYTIMHLENLLVSQLPAHRYIFCIHGSIFLLPQLIGSLQQLVSCGTVLMPKLTYFITFSLWVLIQRRWPPWRRSSYCWKLWLPLNVVCGHRETVWVGAAEFALLEAQCWRRIGFWVRSVFGVWHIARWWWMSWAFKRPRLTNLIILILSSLQWVDHVRLIATRATWLQRAMWIELVPSWFHVPRRLLSISLTLWNMQFAACMRARHDLGLN